MRDCSLSGVELHSETSSAYSRSVTSGGAGALGSRGLGPVAWGLGPGAWVPPHRGTPPGVLVQVPYVKVEQCGGSPAADHRQLQKAGCSTPMQAVSS
jgi:hypothetical protein